MHTIARLDQNKASLVALTWTPVVMNHWKWKTVCLSFEAPRHNKTLPLLGAYEGRFYIKQDVTPALKCIKNMSISMIGERQFALQTMRLFVEGEFKQTFDNCLHMFPCSLHGPLCEILSNGEPHVCPIRKTKTCNQSEAVGLVLLFFIAAFRPSLFHSLGPFTILPSEQICGLATMCSPESLVFYELTVESALSLVPQHPPTTAIGKALSNKIWSLFRASPTPSDWKYGVGALAHVMRGYMYATRVGGVIADTRKALVEYDAALSSCLGKTITCIKVPRALAENGISLVAWNIGNLEVSANLGNLRAQLMLGLQRESPENARERVKWIARASEGGDADAQYRMAMVYETGCPEEAGLSKNVAEAMRLYRLAAEQGQYDAQYKVGVFLVDGGGTTSSGVRVETQQYREGVRWLQLAAHQGNVEAMHKLDDLDIHLY
ncbi:hypothetical protein Pelo_17311 [Pelomyxa schiedti]|nr:hypothetical protein Pelo_17311 [Pelomyxa schiedti]